MKCAKKGTQVHLNAGHKVSLNVFFMMINTTECLSYVTNSIMNEILRYFPKREGTRFSLTGKFIFDRKCLHEIYKLNIPILEQEEDYGKEKQVR